MASSRLRHALVTGASGAVGSAVVQRLVASGVRVRALVRRRDESLDPGVEQVRGDLTQAASLQGVADSVEAVIHCAAAVGADLKTCERVNVQGTRDLLGVMSAAGCRRLVHVSTLSVYGTSERRHFDEDSPLWADATSPYGFTKAAAEGLVRAAEQAGIRSVILRAGLVLSMHERSRWGPAIFERARSSEAPIFPSSLVPHVHVENLVDAIFAGLGHDAALEQAFNVIDGEAEVADYFAVVYPAIGRPVPCLTADTPCLRFAHQKIRERIGYAPRDRWREFLGALAARAASLSRAPSSEVMESNAAAAAKAQGWPVSARGSRSSGG
jgi:nucleoside-diphosphate-sugar epimerase